LAQVEARSSILVSATLGGGSGSALAHNEDMVPLRFLIAACVLGLPCADAKKRLKLEASVTPVAKVLTLLQEMVAKGTAAKQEEEVKFAALAVWCTGTRKRKQDEVIAGSDLIAKQEAKIQKAVVHIKESSARIHELEEDVGRWAQDQKSANTVRSREKEDYTATAADYSESLDALTGAIETLKKQNVDRPQADLLQQALLQVQSQKLVPKHAKRALAAFLQQAARARAASDEDSLLPAAPEANAYEFQSGGVIEMLEKLKDSFADKKSELDKEELGAQQGFEAIIQQLSDNTENAKHEVSKKTESRAETARLKAETEGDLAATALERTEDQKDFVDADTLCKTKSQDFEQRQQLRAGELTAIKKAIDIIGGQSVAGSSEKHLPQLLQIRQRASLAQLRNGQQSPIQDRIAAFLGERAKSSGSRLLALVSERVATDPFNKVKKMIKDLIVKLMEESTAETEHKGWCDTELTTNLQTRDHKSTEVAKLSAQAEDLTSTIASLADDIATLTEEVQELDSAMAKASAERSSSKAENSATVKDATVGQLAVTQAISVLKEFYAKSADATALLQAPQTEAPETFDGAYKGMLPEGGGVIDFLEVILTDFARLETETATSEATEQEDYSNYMFESKKDKALKENGKAHKQGTKVDKESELHSTEGELKVTQEQLDKALAYYEKLKPTCVDSGITYEERVKRREEEIVSLQEAVKILAGTDIA